MNYFISFEYTYINVFGERNKSHDFGVYRINDLSDKQEVKDALSEDIEDRVTDIKILAIIIT